MALLTSETEQHAGRMLFMLAGFEQVANIRRYHFNGLHENHTAQPFVVSVDLDLIHRYKIPIQELPLLCRGVLERGRNNVSSMKFTEADMATYVQDRTSATLEHERKRRPHRPVKRATPPPPNLV